MDAKDIYRSVQERYGFAAENTSQKYGQTIAKALGYTEDELALIPQDANLGLSCGNPMSIARLKEGETVIDLGSGAGFDVFLAAQKVGRHGTVIGIDMNKTMIERANQNKANTGAENVRFVESRITKVDIQDLVADCIISNCVINLVPEEEKQLAFNEIFRLLKFGGRLAISDILLKKDLPPELKQDMGLYVGCIAGASKSADYELYLRRAGFENILIVDNKHDLNVYTSASGDDPKSCCGGAKKIPGETPSCCDEKEPGNLRDLEGGHSGAQAPDFNEWAGSFQVYAVKARAGMHQQE